MSDASPDAIADRATGVLLGLAVGDALGAGYEFASPPAAGEARMIGGGLGDWAPGEWTDDTQMAICVARGARSGGLDAVAVGAEFLAWLADGPKDVGIQTRRVLSSARTASDLPRLARHHFETNPKHSAGNGSLMRTAPVALAYLGNDSALVDAAREVSALTHADPLCTEACVLWCIAIDRAVREQRLDGVDDGMDYVLRAERDVWRIRLDEVRADPPSQFTPNGFVVTALQAALAAIHQTPIPPDDPPAHLVQALDAAVHIGDDTDTVAAIAGSLLGARWGASAIPRDWRAIVHGWPGLRAHDLEAMALELTPEATATT